MIDEALQFQARRAGAVQPGKVMLVGAGPGAPDLLTVRASRILSQARLLLYDHLVSPGILQLAPPGAELICVGKESSRHTLPQAAIIELMVSLARSGKSLVRLKGGDPYIFGRGGEEAQGLAAAGIAFEVVPGISAAQGAAASAGIPLTHRDHATSVVFATGHMREDGRGDGRTGCRGDLDWSLLARPRQTAVIYMGLGTLPRVCTQLIAHGLAADTPAAIIERATCPGQRTIVGDLRSLPALAALHDVHSPALVMIGSVVSLHAQLGVRAADAFAPVAAIDGVAAGMSVRLSGSQSVTTITPFISGCGPQL